MTQKSIYPKVASDMYWVQLFWAFGYLGVMLLIHIVKMVTAIVKDLDVDDYFTTVFFSSNIFMLVIGIVSAYGLLQHFVSIGVTRRDYFKGASMAAVGLALTIPILASLMTLIERLVVNVINVQFRDTSSLTDIRLDNMGSSFGDIFGNIVQSVVVSPFVDLQSHWLLAILVFAFNIFGYYLIGWLIGAGFYRCGGLLGLAFIVIALIIVLLQDIFVRAVLGLPLNSAIVSFDVPVVVAAIGILIVISLLLWLIRQLTKRVVIKM